jgi:NADH:ubiquinone oxidoreductase subunit 2 (subunit N)
VHREIKQEQHKKVHSKILIMKIHKRTRQQIKILVTAGLIMFLGLLVFKLIPMLIWGNDILFDASAHITIAIFVLYTLWFFIDQNQQWRIPYFIFSGLVLFIISIQRIMVSAHNDVGLLAGLIISLFAIYISQNKKINKKLEF